MNELPTLARWLDEADAVLIAAGAGLTAAAGIDYTDPVRFAELFPAFVRRGFTARYELIGHPGLSEDAFWAYWALHVDDIRFGPRHDAPYRQLEALTRGKDHFVFTSNVDQLFARNGFDGQKIFTPQGDYGLMQCVRNCAGNTWPSEPAVRQVLAHTDPQTQTVTDRAALPRCPDCGGRVFLNVRLDPHFVETPYAAQQQRLQAWLAGLGGRRLLIVEIGAGYNTPGVIRWPCERLIHTLPEARMVRMVRINRDHPDYRWPREGRTLAIAQGAAAVITAWSQRRPA